LVTCRSPSPLGRGGDHGCFAGDILAPMTTLGIVGIAACAVLILYVAILIDNAISILQKILDELQRIESHTDYIAKRT